MKYVIVSDVTLQEDVFVAVLWYLAPKVVFRIGKLRKYKPSSLVLDGYFYNRTWNRQETQIEIDRDLAIACVEPRSSVPMGQDLSLNQLKKSLIDSPLLNIYNNDLEENCKKAVRFYQNIYNEIYKRCKVGQPIMVVENTDWSIYYITSNKNKKFYANPAKDFGTPLKHSNLPSITVQYDKKYACWRKTNI